MKKYIFFFLFLCSFMLLLSLNLFAADMTYSKLNYADGKKLTTYLSLDQKNILRMDGSKFYIYKGGDLSKYTTVTWNQTGSISGVDFTDEKNVWVLARTGSSPYIYTAWKYNGTSWISCGSMPSTYNYWSVGGPFVQKDGKPWFCVYTSTGKKSRDNVVLTIENFKWVKKGTNLSNNSRLTMDSVFVNKNGTIFAYLDYMGAVVYKFNSIQNTWQSIGAPYGGISVVLQMNEDKDGNLVAIGCNSWGGQYYGSIAKYNGSSWVSLEDAPGEPVGFLIDSSQALWFTNTTEVVDESNYTDALYRVKSNSIKSQAIYTSNDSNGYICNPFGGTSNCANIGEGSDNSILIYNDDIAYRLTININKFNFNLVPNGQHSVTVDIINNSDIENVRFKVYRSSDNLNWKFMGFATNNQYIDSGLQPGTKYYYKVSGYGSELLAKSIDTVPSEVVALSSKVGGLTWSKDKNSSGKGYCILNWNESKTAKGYKIYLFDGYQYHMIQDMPVSDVKDTRSWDSRVARIFPSENTLNALAENSASEKLFTTPATGYNLDDSAKKLYSKTKGTWYDLENLYYFRITAYNDSGESPFEDASLIKVLLPNRVDTEAPIGSVNINNGTAVTNTVTVTLSYSASDPEESIYVYTKDELNIRQNSDYKSMIGEDRFSGVGVVRFSNDGTNWSAWEPYDLSSEVNTKQWELIPGNGAKTVYVQFRDKAGNINSGVILDYIQLFDETSPDVGSSGGATIINNYITASFLNSVAHYQRYNLTGNPEVWVTGPDSPCVALSDVQYAQLRNISTFFDYGEANYRLEFEVTDKGSQKIEGMNIILDFNDTNIEGVTYSLEPTVVQLKKYIDGSYRVLKNINGQRLSRNRYRIGLGNDSGGIPMIIANGGGKYTIDYSVRISTQKTPDTTSDEKLEIVNRATFKVYTGAGGYTEFIEPLRDGKQFEIVTLVSRWDGGYR